MADPINGPEYAAWREARAELNEMMEKVKRKQRRRTWWSVLDLLLSVGLLVLMAFFVLDAAGAAGEARWDEATYRMVAAIFLFFLARDIRPSSR
jgi:sterol desaturase/sphingolipid hydroxylase (fatty acid hydroxylase superfamily)